MGHEWQIWEAVIAKTKYWLLKSWNEMFCAEAKATWIDASRCVGWPDRVRQNGKVSLWQLQKCTARNINVDGFSSEESVTCLVVPCSPQRALPLAGKAGRRKKKKTNVCVSILCRSGYLLFTPLEDIQLVI